MASLSDPRYDRLLMSSPLRRTGVSVGAVLLLMLSIAAASSSICAAASGLTS